jgi:murein DD-endopeptidase MepM/ murein hydrolase activator NlpD
MRRLTMTRVRAYAIAAGLAAATGAGVYAAIELPFVNWQPAVPPLAAEPLIIRHDAKGDGRFESPRSGNRKHRGVDLAGRLESPVVAVRSGKVLEVGHHRGLGRFVVVQHDRGLRTLYAHLSSTTVAEGARIAQGDVVGTLGKTGNARHPSITPHVHFEATRDGAVIDPQLLGLQFQEPMVATGEATDASGGE